jgi:hypothetical protein
MRPSSAERNSVGRSSLGGKNPFLGIYPPPPCSERQSKGREPAGAVTVVEAVVPTAYLSTGPWYRGLYKTKSNALPETPKGDDGVPFSRQHSAFALEA